MSKFRDLNDEFKPREKYKKYGSGILTEVELLAIILQSGNKHDSVMTLSQKLIEKYNGLSNLLDIEYQELTSNYGIGDAKAMKIRAISDIITAVKKENINTNDTFTTPSDIFKLCYDISISKQEKFVLICLDNKTRLIERSVLYVGTTVEISISPKEIFKKAIEKGSHFIIIVHNHPSGDLTPSQADIETTKKIVEIGKMVSIQVLDHIIVTNNDYLSIRYENSDIF